MWAIIQFVHKVLGLSKIYIGSPNSFMPVNCRSSHPFNHFVTINLPIGQISPYCTSSLSKLCHIFHWFKYSTKNDVIVDSSKWLSSSLHSKVLKCLLQNLLHTVSAACSKILLVGSVTSHPTIKSKCVGCWSAPKLLMLLLLSEAINLLYTLKQV